MAVCKPGILYRNDSESIDRALEQDSRNSDAFSKSGSETVHFCGRKKNAVSFFLNMNIEAASSLRI